MVDRLSQELVVDNQPAGEDLGYSPRTPSPTQNASWAFHSPYWRKAALLMATPSGISLAKRLFDLALALSVGALLLPAIVLVAILVKSTSPGPALYWSSRIGRNNEVFKMPKFRTMREGAPELATHLLPRPDTFLTPIGGLLRRSSLDELPQLWSIVKGDMSFVGPRPALYNQYDLIALRNAHHVQQLVPGLTGWAQVNGRDEIPIADKVALDAEYLRRSSLLFDLKILTLTALKVVRRDNISH